MNHTSVMRSMTRSTIVEIEFFNVLWEMLIGEKHDWDREDFKKTFRDAIYRKARDRKFKQALRLRLMVRATFTLMELEFGRIELDNFPVIVIAVVDKAARGLRYGH